MTASIRDGALMTCRMYTLSHEPVLEAIDAPPSPGSLLPSGTTHAEPSSVHSWSPGLLTGVVSRQPSAFQNVSEGCLSCHPPGSLGIAW